MQPNDLPPADPDPQETAEWHEAFDALLQAHGPARARQLLDGLVAQARERRVGWQPGLNTPYVNTIAVEAQPPFPGDLAIEEQLASLMRWNALAMVVRANQAYGELGGHIASYASAADLFEVGFNHFFRARSAGDGGDLVFFQPHSAPGVYARAFLEGRLSEADLRHYRQEIVAPAQGARGLSSYPHPWLMPDFWQFPTGSMGIGPISSIYHARFMRYLAHRGLLDTNGRTVWGVFGDGEMDEPESMSALTLAARERLDNLVWVVNCNLQRLDGPVRGNGRIVDELERLFAGAGWNVVKLLWGSDWDGLFARDATGTLAQTLGDTVDGQMQTFAAKDGRFNRENFFGQNPALSALVEGLTDEQIDRLKRGGHDLVKIHAAYHAAVRHRGQPTVILAHTKKGYGMGSAGQGRMTTHSQKKLDADELLAFRDRFQLPLSDEQATQLQFHKPADDSAAMRYLRDRRAALGGAMPRRETACEVVPVPELARIAGFALQPDGKAMSTTMAFVRLLGQWLKDPVLGPRIVPIVADEARTFGMANLFKQVGIYSSVGQVYAPEDIGSVLSYREALDGQILEEGISEAGAIASWTAAATSYSVHGLAMLPFYIYYSMFGFQRVGDAIWAAADQRARGFLLGATAGRTTLGGEGLQHQDGSSHLVAATIPNCKAYDPAFAGEMAVIVDAGMREMLIEQRDVFYYVTLMNASYAQPDLPPEAHAGVLRGGYRLAQFGPVDGVPVTLMGSGAILTEVLQAAEQLAGEGMRVHVCSITSWSELARDAEAAEADPRQPWLHALLADTQGPIVAASDYVRAVPEALRAWLPADRRYRTLGTDGFGRSDTRAALRQFFGVDAAAIVQTARRESAR
ncbi:MAG: alpha-ketoglutarate dehydrogenase [Hydrogenophaga sp.]|uniref:alpha-ketoglutarate dehydrogenase n=1 Tax=Hydrogenophaga sp. TaxID=1904254 RepID=UPI001D31CB43|nr:alpha-ketoglutarate dehydrogenase [Hydrogenophaga sp.]MBX3611198.1 alpha-ketoglutarate dehydrogenase [Hydrogenophaga sp.]